MERRPDPADRRKVAYQLTEKGRDLLPVLISLRQWGERWVSGLGGPVESASAYFMKSPAVQLPDDVARADLEAFIAENTPAT